MSQAPCQDCKGTGWTGGVHQVNLGNSLFDIAFANPQKLCSTCNGSGWLWVYNDPAGGQAMKLFVIIGYNTDGYDSLYTWLVKAFETKKEARAYLRRLRRETKAISEKVFKVEDEYRTAWQVEEPFDDIRFRKYLRDKKRLAAASKFDPKLSFDIGHLVGYKIDSVESGDLNE